MISATADTIVAPITGNDPAPVAGLRLSGPDAWRIAKDLMPSAAELTPLTAVFGRFRTGDEGFLLPFDQRSYTGETSVELFIHGSRASRVAILDAAIGCGARMARPGEFTERAFLTGKMDLTQAEAVRDTIEASTELQLRQANLLRGGALRKCVDSLRGSVRRWLTEIEARVDFSEEIGELDEEGCRHALQALREAVAELRDTAEAGRIVREGLRIAIVGRPNAGKSSLLNALLDDDRAIVTEVAGTTRDTIEESLEVHGLRCVLVDTAGIRDTDDLVEQEGVRRARRAIESSDLIWHLYDATVGWSQEDDELAHLVKAPVIRVATKIDLLEREPAEVSVSSRTRQGIPRLLDSIADHLPDVSRPLVRPRQEALLGQIQSALDDAIIALESGLPIDLLSVQLREVDALLGEITGDSPSAGLLDAIFRDFCIGK